MDLQDARLKDLAIYGVAPALHMIHLICEECEVKLVAGGGGGGESGRFGVDGRWPDAGTSTPALLTPVLFLLAHYDADML